MTRIALLGEFDPAFPPHQATIAACAHSATALRQHVAPKWISTAELTVDSLRDFSALWIAPGSPYKSLPNTLAAIRHARERGIPCLGTCGGFQHMILEYARNALGFVDAQHAEYDPYASELFVTQLECSLVGRELVVALQPESRIARIYGTLEAREQYYCNFGVNPERVSELQRGELRVTGSDADGEVRVVELPKHPFYIGTLFVPQLVENRASTPSDNCLRAGGVDQMTGVITNDHVDAALQRIRRQVHETPFLSARRLGDRADGRDELTGEAFTSGTAVVRRLRPTWWADRAASCASTRGSRRFRSLPALRSISAFPVE